MIDGIKHLTIDAWSDVSEGLKFIFPLMDIYWSSTTYLVDINKAFAVHFLFPASDTWFGTQTTAHYIRCVRGDELNFDNLVLLKKRGKIKVGQNEIDFLSPSADEDRKKKQAEKQRIERENEARERAERERQKFQLGNKVCSHTYSNNSGWCGTIENISGERIQVELTDLQLIAVVGFFLQYN